jgi:hypothetical protein
MLLFNEDLDGLENHQHQDDPELHELNEDMNDQNDQNDQNDHDYLALSDSDYETNDNNDQVDSHIIDQHIDISDIGDQHFEHTGIDEPNVGFGEEDISHIYHELDKIGGNTHPSFTGNDCSCSGNCYAVCVESCASHCSSSYNK